MYCDRKQRLVLRCLPPYFNQCLPCGHLHRSYLIFLKLTTKRYYHNTPKTNLHLNQTCWHLIYIFIINFQRVPLFDAGFWQRLKDMYMRQQGILQQTHHKSLHQQQSQDLTRHLLTWQIFVSSPVTKTQEIMDLLTFT